MGRIDIEGGIVVYLDYFVVLSCLDVGLADLRIMYEVSVEPEDCGWFV